ncbi:hypothetical protein GLW04_09175 [Halobacillus litoralis]|uniref:Uncharacterized protein n=1 Tax=Halobacillus litoralis TaxID=45668 RepID=A0A845DRN7_9BACI|nr:hypothetical protein [Halobacillus litoralis]MYL20056.1 hypothetical protein [Halobacillus litoralis]
MVFDDPNLMKVSTELGVQAAKNGAQSIWDKVKVYKETRNDKELISVMEEVIRELLDDKNQLIHIAQTYDEQLVARKVSEDDVDYITTNIIPLLEKLMDASGTEEEAEKNRENIETFKPLLSKETFNILQTLGFNYKRAIGEPLTDLVNGLISSQMPVAKEKELERQKLFHEQEIEYIKMIRDEEAYKRYLKLTGRE